MIQLSTGRVGLVPRLSPQDVDFGLARTDISIQLWQDNGRNLTTVTGKLTLDGRPVTGAAIRAGPYLLRERTAADGAFSFLRDQTVLSRTVLRVADAASALLGGQPVTADEQRRLSGGETAVSVAYEITLDGEPQWRQGDQNVRLSGKLTFADAAAPAPPVTLWGYQLRGTIHDAGGKPVAGAVVSLAEEGNAEATALSTPSDADGRYLLRFYPEKGDALQVRAAYGPTLYVGPTPVTFPALSSSILDLVLPANGDQLSGALKPQAVRGEEYFGPMIGLATADRPVRARVTWPDKAGTFSLAIPVVNFAGSVAFYQAQLRVFSAEQIAPGLPIPDDVMPSRLEPGMPTGLHPFQVAT